MKASVLIFAAGLAVRLVLISLHPIVYGGDTVLRLVNHDRIVISYQLPLLQAIIHYLSAVTLSPAAARVAMSVIGAIAGVGFYYLARHFVAERCAFHGALLCAVHPFLLGLSTVPYQEPLMLGALFFAFHFLLSGRAWESSLALAAACLTRYEAWAACPVFVFEYAGRSHPSMSRVVKGLLLYGWAPLAWLLYSSGLSPEGSFVLESAVTPERLIRFVYLGWITTKFTPWPVLIGAAAGLFYVAKTPSLRRRLRGPGMFLGIFLIAILFSAHGVDPNPERFVTSREAVLPIAGVLLLCAIGLEVFPKPWTAALVALSVVWGILGSHLFLQGETSKPELELSYALARYLDDESPEGRVLVLARHTPGEAIQYYLDRAHRYGGERALDAAKRELEQVRLEPINYLRTLIHARQRERFIGVPVQRFWRSPAPERDFPGIQSLQTLAVWSDYEPGDSREAEYLTSLIRQSSEVHTLRTCQLSISIRRLNDPGQ